MKNQLPTTTYQNQKYFITGLNGNTQELGLTHASIINQNQNPQIWVPASLLDF